MRVVPSDPGFVQRSISGAALLIRNQSRNLIHLFPILDSDRLTVQMGNRVTMICRVVLNYFLLLYLYDGVLHVRVHVSAKLMERISSRPTTETNTGLPTMRTTSQSPSEVSETDEREGQ
jgi:hypothetical protein